MFDLAIAAQDVLVLNGESDYGFHPSLPKFRDLWNQNELAIVNGVVAYDRSKVSFWDHIQTDRPAGLKPWARCGPWPTIDP